MNTEEVPDEWRIVHDPYNRNDKEYLFDIHEEGDDTDPTRIVTVFDHEDGWEVEVQHADATNVSSGHLLPLAERDLYDTVEEAYERAIEQTKTYSPSNDENDPLV